MENLTDQQLLRDYTGRRSEPAFAELVRRHIDLVHSAALRMVRDPHLAQDVTQGVFVALAQNAGQLANRPVLSGWLHRTAQNLAANAVRSTVRRRAREQEAAAMNELLAHQSDAVWEHIAPHLDAALGELAEPDRDALLLRYFERKSAREMAQTLGISDEAAQKRVTRAVERLREFFAKRGVTIGAGGLVVLLSTNAVQAAPAGLAIAISAAVALTGTAVTTATVTATKAIAMTTLQKTLITASLAAAVSAGIYEAHQASTLRTQIQTLQQQQTPLAGQIEQLQRERSDLTNRLALLSGQIVDLRSNSAELLRLRSEAGALLSQNQTLARAQAERPAVEKIPVLNKGFGTLGEYLPVESLADAGNGSPEALLKTTLWALREGKLDRVYQFGGVPTGGESKPGDTVGQPSLTEAVFVKMFQHAFTNTAGFHLSSWESSDGRQYEVRVEPEPLEASKNDSSISEYKLTLVLEKKSNGWILGDNSVDSNPK